VIVVSDMPFSGTPDKVTEVVPRLEAECVVLLEAWQSKATEKHGLVLKTDIDPLELPAFVLPSTFIYQREPGPDRVRFKCRLAGTSLVEAFGMEPTRHYLDEMMDPAFYPVRSRFFELAATRGCPIYYRGTLALKERDFIAFSRILLPVRLKSTDPTTEMLVGAMVFLAPGSVSEADLQQAKANDGVICAFTLDDGAWTRI
jgi:hypothetical protein